MALTFLGRTLGMSSEYFSTWYDSAGGHMVAASTVARETTAIATDGMAKTVNVHDCDRTDRGLDDRERTGCPRTTAYMYALRATHHVYRGPTVRFMANTTTT